MLACIPATQYDLVTKTDRMHWLKQFSQDNAVRLSASTGLGHADPTDQLTRVGSGAGHWPAEGGAGIVPSCNSLAYWATAIHEVLMGSNA
ncbi:hypothetical protein BaRGS_00008638 [Batillaria attramentaria]|uniref:Uncharacterized protein n=1 Tax=Batillaria attramentaria TaxID=370345 RepID=A0ABD0LLH8_9CAEN